MSRGKPHKRHMQLERRNRDLTPVDDDWSSLRKKRVRLLQQYIHRRVVAQVWSSESSDRVESKTFSISRRYDTKHGELTSRELNFQDLRDCRRALRDVKKWWRDECKRTRRPLWRRLLSF